MIDSFRAWSPLIVTFCACSYLFCHKVNTQQDMPLLGGFGHLELFTYAFMTWATSIRQSRQYPSRWERLSPSQVKVQHWPEFLRHGLVEALLVSVHVLTALAMWGLPGDSPDQAGQPAQVWVTVRHGGPAVSQKAEGEMTEDWGDLPLTSPVSVCITTRNSQKPGGQLVRSDSEQFSRAIPFSLPASWDGNIFQLFQLNYFLNCHQHEQTLVAQGWKVFADFCSVLSHLASTMRAQRWSVHLTQNVLLSLCRVSWTKLVLTLELKMTPHFLSLQMIPLSCLGLYKRLQTDERDTGSPGLQWRVSLEIKHSSQTF